MEPSSTEGLGPEEGSMRRVLGWWGPLWTPDWQRMANGLQLHRIGIKGGDTCKWRFLAQVPMSVGAGELDSAASHGAEPSPK